MITRNLRKATVALGVAAMQSATSSNAFVTTSSLRTIATLAVNPMGMSNTDACSPFGSSSFNKQSTATSSALGMGMGRGTQRRGLEIRREGATPTEGGMELYLKAAEDGTSVGDCPFAHYVRLVLEEKGLPYTVRPCAGPDDKPLWLLDHYEGKLPCLHHKKEAYVESDVIAAYLDYFFGNKDEKPTPERRANLRDAEDVLVGFFPAIAGYLKDTNSDDEAEDSESLAKLEEKLSALEDHLQSVDGNLDGTESFGILDCKLVPQLYHLSVGIDKFKPHGKPNLKEAYPAVHGYLEEAMKRPSFRATEYSPDTIEWGWSNARQK